MPSNGGTDGVVVPYVKPWLSHVADRFRVPVQPQGPSDVPDDDPVSSHSDGGPEWRFRPKLPSSIAVGGAAPAVVGSVMDSGWGGPGDVLVSSSSWLSGGFLILRLVAVGFGNHDLADVDAIDPVAFCSRPSWVGRSAQLAGRPVFSTGSARGAGC